jgi:hypothetical protein
MARRIACRAGGSIAGFSTRAVKVCESNLEVEKREALAGGQDSARLARTQWRRIVKTERG